jgi:hypothetical protein
MKAAQIEKDPFDNEISMGERFELFLVPWQVRSASMSRETHRRNDV